MKKSVGTLVGACVCCAFLSGCSFEPTKGSNVTLTDPVNTTANSVRRSENGLNNGFVTRAATKPRQAFVGTWIGKYANVDDELVIREGNGPAALDITLHATFTPPAEVTGKVVDSDTVSVPEQEISGFPGTAELTLSGDKLVLRQSGLGLTFEGIYERVEH